MRLLRAVGWALLASAATACAGSASVVPARRVIVVTSEAKDYPTPEECARHCAIVARPNEAMRCEGARLDVRKTYDLLHRYIALVCVFTPARTE